MKKSEELAKYKENGKEIGYYLKKSLGKEADELVSLNGWFKSFYAFKTTYHYYYENKKGEMARVDVTVKDQGDLSTTKKIIG